MDISSLRWRYYAVSSAVVVLVLAAFQYWQETVDWRSLARVAVVYFVLSVGIDLVRASRE